MVREIKKIIAREGWVLFLWLIVSIAISIKFGDRVEMNVHHFYPDLFRAMFFPCIYVYLIIRSGILVIQILKGRRAIRTLGEK